jgi:hypothetical protein
VLDFRGGQTEAWLNPPKGDYQMKLELVSNIDGTRCWPARRRRSW